MDKSAAIVIYTNHTQGFTARLSIDASKYCPFAVMGVTMARMFPDADPKARDPVFDAIVKRLAAERQAKRAAR